MGGHKVIEEEHAKLVVALGRLIHFCQALVTMGALETPRAMESELAAAFEIYWECSRTDGKRTWDDQAGLDETL